MWKNEEENVGNVKQIYIGICKIIIVEWKCWRTKDLEKLANTVKKELWIFHNGTLKVHRQKICENLIFEIFAQWLFGVWKSIQCFLSRTPETIVPFLNLIRESPDYYIWIMIGNDRIEVLWKHPEHSHTSNYFEKHRKAFKIHMDRYYSSQKLLRWSISHDSK